MPFRTKHTYTTPRGTYNTRNHSFAGRGAAPAGMHKAAAPTINDVPVTTSYPSGRVVRTAPGRAPEQLAPPSTSPPALAQIEDLLTPGPSARDTAEAAARLGVKPKGILSELGSDIGGPAGQKIGSGLEREAAKGISKIAQAAAVPIAMHQRPKRVAGHKVLGTPTLAQVLHAASKGTLLTNRRGRVTIPATRHAARDLAQARQAVRRSGQITGITHGGEAEQFANALAKSTHLDPRFVGAWVQAEGGGYAAGGEAGKNNWLGVGYPGRPTPFGRSGYFSGSGAKAGRATADWIKGRIGSDYGYGAAPGIEAIIPKAAGKGPQAALRALQESGWGTNVASVAQNLPSIGVTTTDPAAAKRLQNATLVAQRLGIPTTPRAALGPPPKQVVTRFRAALVAAHELDKARLPYVWGGGHNAGKVRVGSGVDCSGAVSFVLQHMGVKLPGGVVSGEMGRYLEPGPGAVTVFYNAEHTFMKIGDKYFGTSHANPGGGAGFIPTSYEEGEARSGKYNVAHVPGLGGKVALQLGIDATGAGVSGGGISYGPEGTTATVTGGSRKDAPGFSSSPILFSGGAVSPLLATSSPLPVAYQQIQGEGAEPGAESAGGIIEQLLRKKRL